MDESHTGNQSPGKYPSASKQSPEPPQTKVAEQASDALATAKDATAGAVAKVTDQASSLISQVKDKAAAVATNQKDGLADRIGEVADAVHKAGTQFEGQQDWIASAIERGAAELNSIATSLRANDVASLLGEIQSLAKRQPALFVGACLAAGFAVARLGKLVVADVSRADLPTLPEVGHGGH
jgi:hypothetical protein